MHTCEPTVLFLYFPPQTQGDRIDNTQLTLLDHFSLRWGNLKAVSILSQIFQNKHLLTQMLLIRLDTSIIEGLLINGMFIQ